MHVPPAGVDGTLVVDLIRDADRLAALGITDVVVRKEGPVSGGENGDK